MTKLFKKIQKNLFWAIFWENVFCQFLNIPIIYHRAKNHEKLMSHFREKCRTDGRTDGQTTVIF